MNDPESVDRWVRNEVASFIGIHGWRVRVDPVILSEVTFTITVTLDASVPFELRHELAAHLHHCVSCTMQGSSLVVC